MSTDVAPTWLLDRRAAATEAGEILPMPSSARDEDWRRTDISALTLEKFATSPQQDCSSVFADAHAHCAHATPGAAIVEQSLSGVSMSATESLVSQGVTLATLDSAAATHAELVKSALSHVAVDESKFVALWNAHWRGGCFIHVPAGVDARVPVWLTSVCGDGEMIFPALTVVLGANASLTVVDTFMSTPHASLLCDAVSVVTLGDGARLDYIVLQQWGDNAWHFATHRGVVGANAQLRFFGATLGAHLQKTYWESILEGPGAEATMTGMCFGRGQQHIDHQSLQAHRGHSTRSNFLLKVAVRDQAHSVYSGLIDVAKPAQKTDGYVQNRNLLLGPGAQAGGVPRLEIKANDVRCSHGTTAGHIDRDQVLYLESRGVLPGDAERLIVRGFMEDALARCPHPGVRELMGELVDAEIAEGVHSAHQRE